MSRIAIGLNKKDKDLIKRFKEIINSLEKPQSNVFRAPEIFCEYCGQCCVNDNKAIEHYKEHINYLEEPLREETQ